MRRDFVTSSNEEMRRKDAQKLKEAMEFEFQTLTDMNTWKLEQLPEGRKVVKTKWVFDNKRDSSGNISRYKNLLVAKGLSQIYGTDYHGVFSPVSRYATVKLMFSIAALFNWKRV